MKGSNISFQLYLQATTWKDSLGNKKEWQDIWSPCKNLFYPAVICFAATGCWCVKHKEEDKKKQVFLRSVTWEKTWQPCDLLSTRACVSVVSLHPHLWITTAVYYSSAPDTEESNHGWGVKWMKKNWGGGSCWITLRFLSSLEFKHLHDFMAIIHCWDWYLHPCHDSSMWQVHMNADHSSRCSNKVFPMVTRTGLTKCN